MSPRWRYFIPGYLWALPHTLLGLLLAPFYGIKSVRWSQGCLEFVVSALDEAGAQTHGWIIFYRSAQIRGNTNVRIHERVHVVQGFIGGPFYILAYIMNFFWGLITPPDKLYQHEPRWARAYRKIWFERQAFRIEAANPKGWGHIEG